MLMYATDVSINGDYVMVVVSTGANACEVL